MLQAWSLIERWTFHRQRRKVRVNCDDETILAFILRKFKWQAIYFLIEVLELCCRPYCLKGSDDICFCRWIHKQWYHLRRCSCDLRILFFRSLINNRKKKDCRQMCEGHLHWYHEPRTTSHSQQYLWTYRSERKW